MKSSTPADGAFVYSPGEILYRTLLEQPAYGVFISDSEGHLLEVNGTGCEMLGYSREEILSISMKELFPAQAYSDGAMIRDTTSAGQESFVELNLLRKDGSLTTVAGNMQTLPDKNIMMILRDIGWQNLKEREVRHISNLYAMLSQVNQTIVRVKDRGVLFNAICGIALQHGQFDSAMIGTFDGGRRTITLDAFKGTAGEKPCDAIDINEAPYDKGILAQAVRTGKVVTTGCVKSDEATGFLRDEVLVDCIGSFAAIPFRLGEHVVGVLSLVTGEQDYFGQKERAILEEIGMDISFALDTIEIEAERVHAEEALKENEERYRSVYENTHIGLYRITPEGRMIMANPALMRMLGCETLEQLTVYNLSRKGAGPYYPREEFVRQVEAEGEVSGLERAWTRMDGRAIYIRESARAVRDPDGNTLYYEGEVEDITERKIAEKALRTSEDRFRALFENAPASLWEGDFSEVKKSLEKLRLTGVRDIREYLKKNPDALVPLFNSMKVLSANKTTLSLFHAVSVFQLMRLSSSVADPDCGPANIDTLVSIWEGKASFDSETVITTLTGEKRDIIVRWKVVPGFEHDYSKILMSMSDITPLRNFEKELEDSREMYRELVENIYEVIFSVDPQGNILYLSPASERYFGAGYRVMHGAHFNSFIYPEDLPVAERNFEEQRHGRFVPYECRFVVHGGPVKWGIVHPVPVFERGQFKGVRGSILDITERKEAEMRSLRLGEQLRALASGLQSAREDERMSIAREIHDDLGQGLTTLKLGISLVRRSLKESRSAKRLISEVKELSELSRSVDDLVDSVRRISTSLRPGVLDELGLAEAVRWYADQISKQSGIKCTVRINPSKLILDQKMSTALFRICQEALINAVRHSGARKIEVSLSKRLERVQLSIKDNGSGIADENIQDKGSIGILGMKERALSVGGEFTVSRLRPRGTLVKVQVTLRQQQ